MNYFYLAPLIRKRLVEKVPELINVYGAAEFSRLETFDPVTPCAFIIYNGDVTPSSMQNTGGVLRLTQSVTQRWLVVICVNYSDPMGLDDEMLTEGGSLLSDVINAVSGWSPDEKGASPLHRSNQNLPPDYGDGLGFFPVIFETQIPRKLGAKYAG
ncbi:hypothetical protein ACBQ88_17195 [Citrobacter braakii]|uniref:phage tail terminator protein n=1 Tax=Citrobacter braakii TaxID=57706 RepID=UPI0035243EC9